MPRQAVILALLMLGLFTASAQAAEKTIGRQVQTWRPRALEPLKTDPPPATEAPAEVTPLARPEWEAWIMRILSGRPLILFQPAWKGSWPTPRNPWSLTATPGVRGHPDAGFGAEVVLNAGWSLLDLKLEADTHLLWAKSSGITAWRAAVTRGGLSLEGRGWVDDALRPGEWGIRAAYRQPF